MTTPMALFFLALLAAVSPGRPAYEQANKLFAAGQFAEARKALDESLQLDPDLVPALTLRAKMEMADNHFEQAGRTLERALKLDPKAEYAHFLYGLNAFLANDMGQALPRFRQARELNPQNPRTALYLGLTVESLGRDDEAMLLYRDALRLERAKNAVDADTLLPGGRLLLLQGKLDESERWIREAVAVSPKFRDAHFDLARVLLKQGDAQAAAHEGEAALQLQGATITDAQIHYLLIRAWNQAGDAGRSEQHADVLRTLETPKGM